MNNDWYNKAHNFQDMIDQNHPYMSVVNKHLNKMRDDDPDYSCTTNNGGQSRTQDINAMIRLWREARWKFDSYKAGGRLCRQEHLNEYHAYLGRTLPNVYR